MASERVEEAPRPLSHRRRRPVSIRLRRRNRQARSGTPPSAPPWKARVRRDQRQLHSDRPGALWELDLWGRIRRLKESARAQYLAPKKPGAASPVSLIGDVAGNYFTCASGLGTPDRPQYARHRRSQPEADHPAPRPRRRHWPRCHQAEQFLYLARGADGKRGERSSDRRKTP